MRVNIYAEEMTDKVQIIGKRIDGHTFTGLRFYLELPATGPDGTQHQGPFMHRPGDDDSAAVTFWGKRDLRVLLRKALDMLNEHYDAQEERIARARGMFPCPYCGRNYSHSHYNCPKCGKPTTNAAVHLCEECAKQAGAGGKDPK